MQMKKGMWWTYPSLLQPGPGPWAGTEIHYDDPVTGWKKILDWHADNGLDTIIIDVAPQTKDRAWLWFYHHTNTFRSFPEAQVFPDDIIKTNRDTIRAIVAYAGEKKISLYPHHYMFIAPRGLLKGRPRLHDKVSNARRAAFAHYKIDALEFLIGNFCWFEQDYRDFTLECWEEFFGTYPGFAGLVVTPGEFNHCVCSQCKQGWIKDFIDTYADTMRRLDKHAVLRYWAIYEDFESLPKNLTFATKYSFFDCIGKEGLMPPGTKEMLSKIKNMWVFKNLWGENSGPITWFSEQYIKNTVKNSIDSNVGGVFGYANTFWEAEDKSTVSQHVNLLSFASALNGKQEETTKAALSPIFGDSTDKIIEAVDLYAPTVLLTSTFGHLRNEGYGWGIYLPFALKGEIPNPLWDSMGESVRYNAPDWIMGDIMPFLHYAEAAQSKPWSKDFWDDNTPASKICHRDHMAKVRDDALRAVEILDEVKNELTARPGDNSCALRELRILSLSAQIGANHWDKLRNFLAAKVAYLAERNPQNKNIRQELQKMVIEYFEAGYTCLKREIGLLIYLPKGYIDHGFWLKSEIDSDNYVNNKFSSLRAREFELRRLKRMYGMATDEMLPGDLKSQDI